MATAKRRINSTGRKRIPREHIDIRLETVVPSVVQSATARFELGEFGFPVDAKVILEAYQGSSAMRFECGTVEAPKIPVVLQFNELDRVNSILFRLKVIDGTGSGKILGSAERIRPTGNDNEEGKRSIFPIRESDLGAETWRVEIDESGPWLLLNYKIPSFKHRILENSLLRGIILPAAFRTVLERLVDDFSADDGDEDDWRTLWLRYLKETFGIDEDLSELTEDNDKQDWVSQAVRRFCEAHNFINDIRAMTEGTS
jgi:hypothetical protein